MSNRRRSSLRALGVLVGAGILVSGGVLGATAATAAGRYGYITPTAVLRADGPGATTASQGGAVATSADGRTVAVGVLSNRRVEPGRVYIWNRGTDGWTLAATLPQPAAIGYSWFGSELAMSADGRHLAVANWAQRVDNEDSAGAVYLYSLRGATWTLDAQVHEPKPDYLDEFGAALALNADGSELVVQSGDPAAAWGSAVYVFTGTNGTWTQAAVLTGTAGHMLLSSVAVSGDGTLLALAAYNFHTTDYQGSDVLVFQRDPSGAWAQTAQLKQTGPHDSYGSIVAVSTDGTTLVTSSPGTSHTPGVTVFGKTGSDWALESTFVGHNSAATGDFGNSLAISRDGSTVVVGADERSARGITHRGGVYSYHRDTDGWAYLGATYFSRSHPDDFAGRSVAVSGDGQELVIGVPGYSTNGDFHTKTGAAYIVGG